MFSTRRSLQSGFSHLAATGIRPVLGNLPEPVYVAFRVDGVFPEVYMFAHRPQVKNPGKIRGL